jgi:hypothetical protein
MVVLSVGVIAFTGPCCAEKTLDRAKTEHDHECPGEISVISNGTKVCYHDRCGRALATDK